MQTRSKTRFWIRYVAVIASLVTPSLNLLAQTGISAYIAEGSSFAGQVEIWETSPDYSLIHTIPITNSANGLAITPDNAFIYVAANGADGTEINVIETATNTVIATLAPSGTAQFLAVTPNGKFVYLTNNSPSVDVIDTNTNTVSSIITVGSGAEGIAVAPNGLRVYVANTTSNNVSVIDANPTSGTYNQVVATVTVGTAPEQVAVTPDSQFVYVTNLLDNTVSVIDTSTNTVTNVVTVGAHPRYVAIGNTPSGINAYVGNSTANTISVINTANPSVVAATITLSTGNDVKPIAITPDGLTLLVANGNSILTVIDTANNTELANQTLGSIPNFIVMSNFIPPVPPAPLPPSNLTGQLRKVIFATQTEYIHKLQWSPSSDTTVVDYILSRNGSQIAQINASGPFEYNDQNRHKNESDVYSLVSVNASGTQSTPITLNFPSK